MHLDLLGNIILLLTLAVLTIALLKRFNIASILSYLLVGILVSPYALGIIKDASDIHIFAELGLVFLMFSTGLEFSLAKMLALKKEVLGLGGCQVLITSVVGGYIAWIFYHNLEEAIVIGGIIALSSTAIVMKQLGEQLEVNSRHGHIALSILIFQDIAVIPLLIVIPTMAQQEALDISLSLGNFAKGGIVLLLMLSTGHWILRPLLRELASFQSAELFTLSILLISLSAAWATYEVGLSLALDAFIAGMMLSETEYIHQIKVDIRPFRDVFLGLFFISIGMLINLQALLPIFHWVILFTIILLVLKTVIITLLSISFGSNRGVALRTGIILSQGGEFGFALLAIAASSQVLSESTVQMVLSIIILSMMVAPYLIAINGSLAKKLMPHGYLSQNDSIKKDLNVVAHEFQDHVIICGYGRISQSIVRFIEDESHHYVAIDLDAIRVQEAQQAGESVFFGDAANLEILQTIGIQKARILVISLKSISVTKNIIRQVRMLRQDIPILVRTRDETKLDIFYQEGATEVVPEGIEASLIMASHLLLQLNVPMSSIARKINSVRKNRYQLLRGYFPGEEFVHEESAHIKERMLTVSLPKGANCIGKAMGALNLEDRDVVFTALRREGIRGKTPSPELIFRENDVLVMYATVEDLEYTKVELLSGH